MCLVLLSLSISTKVSEKQSCWWRTLLFITALWILVPVVLCTFTLHLFLNKYFFWFLLLSLPQPHELILEATACKCKYTKRWKSKDK